MALKELPIPELVKSWFRIVTFISLVQSAKQESFEYLHSGIRYVCYVDIYNEKVKQYLTAGSDFDNEEDLIEAFLSTTEDEV